VRYRLDRSVRRRERGRVLLGGSPVRLLRLTEAGAELVRRLAAGEEVRSTRGVDALVGRLVDAGMLHPDPASAGDAAPDPSAVTVVVPVRDRPRGLSRLLGALARSGLGGIVVVDDGSTVPVEVPHGVELVRHDAPSGPAAARNAGAARARTPFVTFVDSDCLPTGDWLAPLLGHFADPSVAAIAPRVTAPPPTGPEPPRGSLAGYERLRSPLDLGAEPGRVAAGTRTSYVPAATLLVRADRFAEIGGFDASMRYGEDVDLVWRLADAGHRVRYEPRSVVHHDVRATPADWLRQRVGYGSSAAELEARHPGKVAPAVVSPWSVAMWALGVLGHPVAAAVLGAGTVAATAGRLAAVPRRDAVRLAVTGHLAAGRQLAEAVVRAWWPIALPLAVVDRRARRITAAAVAATAADAVVQHRRATRADAAATGQLPGPAAFAGLALLDHAAYGAGVWLGCARRRSLRALLPRRTRAGSVMRHPGAHPDAAAQNRTARGRRWCTNENVF